MRFDIALEEVRSLGDFLRDAVRKTPTVSEKTSHKDIVTEYDVYVEQRFRKMISDNFPQDVVFGEEIKTAAPTFSENVWYIDPIDGTTNFVSRGCGFSVSVAFYQNSAPVFGIVLDVMANELFHACTGRGAYKNGGRLSTKSKKLNEMILSTPVVSHTFLHPHSCQDGLVRLAEDIRAVRSMGCVSLEMCSVAEGRSDIFIAMKSSPWDHNAARIIISEAGGLARTLDNKPIDNDTPTAVLAASSCDTLDFIYNNYIAGGERDGAVCGNRV